MLKIRKDDIQSMYYLSPVQNGMLFHYLLDAGNTAYFNQVTFELYGDLDITVFNKSYNSLLNNHDVLRTVFVHEKLKRPVQAVLKHVEQDAFFEDIRMKSEQEQIEYLELFMEEDRKKGIRIDKELPMRIAVFQTDDDIYKVVWDCHHIIMDGFSVGLVTRELFELYDAYLGSGEKEVSEAPYSNYIRWIESLDKEEAYGYWKSKLDDFGGCMQLPRLDTCSKKDYKMRRHAICIAENDFEGLKRIAAINKVTVNAVVQTLWGILLGKYNNTNDIVWGNVTSGRSADVDRIQDMIGLFINTVPMRMRFKDTDTISDLFRGVNEGIFYGEQYSYMQLADIQHASVGNTPLFEHILAYENLRMTDYISNAQLGAFKIRNVEFFEPTNYDLAVKLEPMQSLIINFEYNESVYSEDVIIALGQSYQKIVGILLDTPDIAIGGIDIIPNEEACEKINKCRMDDNETITEDPRAIQEIFREQARYFPERTAVEFQDISLSYKELDQKSDCIAKLLIKSGIKPNDVVAIEAAHRIEVIIGIWGILKAGAAYLPLDFSYPKARLEHMLGDCAVKTILTCQERPDMQGDYSLMDISGSRLYEEAVEAELLTSYGTEDIAYIIYTSGSTGNPKGVRIMQKSIKRLVKDKGVVQVNKGERVVQLASFAFDASVYEVFAPLLNGGTVVMASDKENTDTATLSRFIRDRRIDICFITTQLFNIIIDYDSTSFNNLKRLFTGGEAASVKHMRKAVEELGENRLYNIYGPTETTVFACAYPVSCLSGEQMSVPIGKPLPDKRFYIMDKNMHLMPHGMPGELYIGGEGLAKGYLNNEELTNQKFVSNPYKKDECLYKTGDLVKWTQDGNIEFLGRIDNQVKIRGFRIELGEVTNQLLSFDRIHEAVVTVDKDENGGSRLCAYFVGEDRVDPEEIRKYLSDKLPDFMIPPYFIQIDAIPLNKNGKFDRSKVLGPAQYIKEQMEFTAPQNERQQILADVWKQVLSIPQDISIDDNFFYLGGDSIKAMQIAAYLKKYNLNVEMKNIFRCPTIRQLSEFVFENGGGSRTSLEETGEVPLNPVQKWFFEENFEDISHFNQSILLKGKERFDAKVVEKAFQSVVRLHPALRMIYSLAEGNVIQRIRGTEEKVFQINSYDLTGYEDAQRIIEETAQALQASLDIEQSPLSRIGHFATRDCDYLLIVIHHLIVDGVSWRILLEDFATAYMMLTKGNTPELTAETTSFKAYSEAVREYSRDVNFENNLECFKAIQAECLETIPKDFTVQSRYTRDSLTYKMDLDADMTQKLLSIRSRRANADANDVLLASLGRAVYRWKNVSNFAVNLECHGRDIDIPNLDLSRTIGWFTAMYPFIINIDSTSDSLQDIQAVGRRTRAMRFGTVCHGIEKYISDREQKAVIDIKPEISFNYLGQFDHELNNELFEISTLDGGSLNSPQQHKCYALDINSAVVNRSLTIEITYNKFEFLKESIEQFAALYIKEIEKGIAAISGETSGALVPKEESEPFPLTSIQMAYLLGKQGIYERGGFTTHCYLEVETGLDMEWLNIALNKLIKRQHMLRAIILPNGTQQILGDVPEYEIAIRDISGQGAIQKQAVIEQEREKTSHAVFDISKWPLFEIKGVKLSDTRKYLFVSYDLMIMDSASAYIFIRELMQIYDEPMMEVPELEYGYYDFVKDLSDIKNGSLYEESREYWKEKLTTFPMAPNLSYKKQPSDASESKFLRLENQMSVKQWNTVKEYAKKHGTTPSAVLLTAYGEVLSFWSNQEHLAINLTVFNRYPFHKEINNIIGDFTSIVLIDIDKSEKKSFWDESVDVQLRLAEALEHRFYDGVEFTRDVARKFNIPQGKAVMPIVFTSLLFEEDVKKDVTRFGDIKWSIGQTPQVFIDLQAMEEDGQLKVFCDYVEELFEKEVIEEMFRQYISILLCIAETGKVEKPEISEKSRAVLEQYNQTDEIILPETLDGLFREQVIGTPDNIAVQFENTVITYSELDRRSGQVANYLMQMGVKPNTTVGVLAKRCIETIVNIMGVLKAGGAYVPINPDFPAERRKYILEDSNCLAMLEPGTYEEKGINLFSSEQTGSISGTEDLAYVIYTSGSTGKPKGVVIRHSAAANTIVDINRKFNVTAKDRIIGLSSMCFDLSVYDILGALSTGATLVMIRDQRDAGEILEVLERERITFWNSVPAIMDMLVETLPEGYINTSLREVLLSGDWIPLKLPEKISRCFRNASVTSLGGATEASIWSIYYPITEIREEWKSIPYGIPLANQKIYVLNYEMQPCPIGVQGEICIGGVGVAEGYMNDREKTDKAFVEHPGLGRIYKTGDFGVMHAEGHVEFLGRKDQQVKIRGYRVELGEIEAVIRQYPLAKEAIVTVFDAPNGVKQLLGYIVPNYEGCTSNEENDSRNAGIIDAATDVSRKVPDVFDLKEYKDFMEQLEEVSTALICENLMNLGVHIEEGKIICVDDIVSENEIKVLYGKLIKQWLKSLVEDGVLKKLSNGIYEGIRPMPEYDFKELWDRADHNKLLVYWEEIYSYMKHCRDNYLQILKGEINAVSLLFPEGGWQRAENVYRYNPVAEYKNNIMREMVAAYVDKMPSDKKINILEFGAGTGGTTASILPILPESRTRYVYTDISTFFTNMAKEKFSEYGFMEYGAFNMDDSPQAQGYNLHEFDIIIGANVLHDAKRLGVTMGYMRDLLVPNGILAIVELTRNTRLNKISTGYLDGFCGYEDERLDMDQTLLSEEQWKSKFAGCGFENVVSLPEKGSPAEAFGEHVIFGMGPSNVYSISFGDVKGFMSRKLPEYMIPSNFIQLDELPLTANGKLDRKKLPVPCFEAYQAANYVEPVTKNEKALAGVWQEILEVERVGLTDNFFEIGGDSLKAIRIVSKARKIGMAFELNDIYRMPSIAELVQLIEQQEKAGMDNVNVGIDNLILLRGGMQKDKNIFFIHAGSGEVGVYLELANKLDPGYSCWGFGMGSRIEYGPKAITVEKLAEEYVEKLREIQPDGPYLLAGWCVGGSIAFEMARLLENEKKDVALVALFNSGVPVKGRIAEEFNTLTEHKLLLPIMPKDFVDRIAGPDADLDTIWRSLLEFLKQSGFDIGMLKDAVPEGLRRVTPNFNMLSYEELIRYMSTFRSMIYARDAYVPAERLNARVEFFAAELEEAENRHYWQDYCNSDVVFHKVHGDHVTVLQGQAAERIGTLLNDTLQNI